MKKITLMILSLSCIYIGHTSKPLHSYPPTWQCTRYHISPLLRRTHRERTALPKGHFQKVLGRSFGLQEQEAAGGRKERTEASSFKVWERSWAYSQWSRGQGGTDFACLVSSTWGQQCHLGGFCRNAGWRNHLTGNLLTWWEAADPETFSRLSWKGLLGDQ